MGGHEGDHCYWCCLPHMYYFSYNTYPIMRSRSKKAEGSRGSSDFSLFDSAYIHLAPSHTNPQTRSSRNKLSRMRTGTKVQGPSQLPRLSPSTEFAFVSTRSNQGTILSSNIKRQVSPTIASPLVTDEEPRTRAARAPLLLIKWSHSASASPPWNCTRW